MPYPIFNLQDVEPRSNQTAYTNDLVVMKQALDARQSEREYYENLNRR